jgi:diguanylate cyclase (GGDEF)-like protein/PAS domain S-box-containing protein
MFSFRNRNWLPGMSQKPYSLFHKSWFKAAAFGLMHLAAALLSDKISFPGASFPTLWLPSGLLVGTLLISSVSDWPIYLLAVFPSSLVYLFFANGPALNTIILTVTTILEGATGAWLIRRVDSHPGQISCPRQIFNLMIFAALGSTALSATLNTTLLATIVPGISYGATWRINWISHILGVLVAAPLVLSWADARISPLRKANPERLIELAILFTGLAVCSLYISVSNYGRGQQNFLIVPFLVWAALRFGSRGISTAGLAFTIIVTGGTLYHLNGFAINDATIDPTMLSLGSFLSISLTTCLIIATLWEQSRLSQEALQESERRYRLLVENQGEGMAIVDLSETFTFANPAAAQIFGVEVGSLVGRNLREFTSPQQFQALLQQTQLRRRDKKSTYEAEIIQPGGVIRNLLITATPQYDANGQFSGAFSVFYDHTERKQVERALQDSRARYQTLFDHSPISIWEEDFSRVKRLIDGLRREGIEDFREFFINHPEQVTACEQLVRFLDVNKAAIEMFGFTDKAEFMAQVADMVHRGPYDTFIEELVAIAEGKKEFNMEGPNDLIDGVVRYHSVHWVVAPGYEKDYRRVIVSISDVTERLQTEEKLRFLSTHDVLTGLYNRNFFEAELERLQNSRMEPTNLMMVDVNGMKTTNDTFGHTAGDDLLRRTAQVLKLSFRKEDIIARIGGDEFVILFQGNIPLQGAINRVGECLAEHNHWYSGPELSLAIGAATGVKGSSLIELYRKADQMMYKEKLRLHKTKSDGKEISPEITGNK